MTSINTVLRAKGGVRIQARRFSGSAGHMTFVVEWSPVLDVDGALFVARTICDGRENLFFDAFLLFGTDLVALEH